MFSFHEKIYFTQLEVLITDYKLIGTWYAKMNYFVFTYVYASFNITHVTDSGKHCSLIIVSKVKTL